jgi:hypothetical protein
MRKARGDQSRLAPPDAPLDQSDAPEVADAGEPESGET